jgi:hypothetical protein
MRWLALLGLFAVWFSVSSAFAQSIVGRAIVDGRTVELLSDKSWRFESEKSTPSCKQLDLGLSFCGSPDVWGPTEMPNPDVHSAFRHDDRLYGLFILEAIGFDDGATLDFYKKTALNNAAAVSGLKSEDVPVFEVTPATVGTERGETIVYGLTVDGLSAVYSNSIIVLSDRSFQISTFEIGSQFTDRHRALHNEFLSLVQIDTSQ